MALTASPPRLSPLFTTTPLMRDMASTLSISPLDTQHGHFEHYQRPGCINGGAQSKVTEFGNTHDAGLCFEKIPVAPIFSGASNIVQDPHDQATSSTSGLTRAHTRSPSLITCLFQSNRSRTSSSSGSSQPTPITPLSISPTHAPLPLTCRPILRRPTRNTFCVVTDSASTSATSEGAGFFGAGFGGALGLTVLDRVVEKDNSGAESDKKRTCSLKFAVKPCLAPSMSTGIKGSSRSSSTSRSSHSTGARRHPCDVPYQPSPTELEQYTPEEEETDDEGYEEDEEGGFTSDEDILGTFAGTSRQTKWNPCFNFRPRSTSSSSIASSTSPKYRARLPAETYSTTDDNDPLPCRGRKISIAAKFSDTCSRHRSPPPPSPSLLSPGPTLAPPAARSPSAAGLCKRRIKGSQSAHEDGRPREWRTGGSFFPPSARPSFTSNALRKVSLPVGSGKCTPILLPTPSISASSSGRTTPIASTCKVGHKVRSGSLPALTRLRCTPLIEACKLDELHALAEATSPTSSAGDARQGLEAVLKAHRV